MSKQEIINELAKAQYVYAAAIEIGEKTNIVKVFYAHLCNLEIHQGLCNYFSSNTSVILYKQVLDELQRDLPVFLPYDEPWFDTPFTHEHRSIYYITDKTLKPRLELMHRTIARLQSELQTSNALSHD